MNVIARVDQMLAGAALTEERFTKPVDVDNEEIVVNSLGTLSQRHRRELCEEIARLEIERASERAAEERAERERAVAVNAAAERPEVLELARASNAAADALAHELRNVSAENRELRVQIAEMKLERLNERSAVTGLPNALNARVN
jgi:hypothetical protein